MDPQRFIYYAGFIAALALCRGLGPVFFYPMLVDLAFDICGMLGWFSGWDSRWLMVSYGLALLIWVLFLVGSLTKPTFIAVLMVDIGTFFWRIVPQFQLSGSGQDFWNLASTGINEIWMVSIFVIVASMAVRSTVVARFQGRRADLLTNPRKRFLLPIGVWAGLPPLLSYLEPWLSASLVEDRFTIASHLLVWGWVALELPAYISHKRLMKQYS
jgi:hypothetical protein